MGDVTDSIWGQLLAYNWMGLLQALLILVIGLIGARIAGRAAARAVQGRMGMHEATLIRRLVFYLIAALVFATALHQLGFRLGVLLGAASILTVAIGFASQTSASNLISGLFLLAERPFQLGDMIKVGDATGEVIAIDLISVKLRTFDNLYVRIPNESLVKSQVTNFSRFPIRRFDLQVGVAYKEDVERVRKVLEQVAERNPLCLDDPKPLIMFQGFGDSSINLQLSVWGRRETFFDLRSNVPLEVKKAFDEQGIEIPFPHVSLYAGSATAPFPVRMLGAAAPGKPEEASGGNS